MHFEGAIKGKNCFHPAVKVTMNITVNINLVNLDGKFERRFSLTFIAVPCLLSCHFAPSLSLTRPVLVPDLRSLRPRSFPSLRRLQPRSLLVPFVVTIFRLQQWERIFCFPLVNSAVHVQRLRPEVLTPVINWSINQTNSLFSGHFLLRSSSS